ncbi:MAG: M23 family metallopeptidase [Bacteroidetes bacterium]|nr:M23 family metallopeptidase [Bacteroidota bacterium]
MIKLVFFILVTVNLVAQENYPKDAFIPPLDIPLKLSGTFGELRSNHFHSGMDIKTGEQTGLNIYAIADGYVSRIKVQSGGYGKALYITHPNGFVSVYGHLNKYNEEINQWVIQKQYQQRSYEVDLYPMKGELEYKQGDIVAYSGNTGRSGGPHLHFEIRTEADQKPVNPLLFGYQVADHTNPSINMLKIYPLGEGSSVDGKNDAADFFPVSNSNHSHLKNDKVIDASGSVYFGINTVDLFNGGLNKNGVYKIDVLIDGKLHYRHQLETFAFDETRYINSLIDYREYKTKSRRVQKTYIQPNNKLSIYSHVINRGILNLKPGKTYQVEMKVYDVAGNVSNLDFQILGGKPATEVESKKATKKHLFNYKGNNVFKNESVIFEVPGKALYDTLHFYYAELPKLEGSFSALHRLHDAEVPLHSWCTLSIRADSLPKGLQPKTLIARVEDDEFESEGGEWNRGFVTTRVRSFGDYCIIVDTIAPQIIPLNIKDQKSLLAQQTIKVKIKDELSGIRTYSPTLNGEWILMEYDAKNDLLTYYFDNLLREGDNAFKLEVWDEKNNYSVYEAILKY